MTKALFLLTDQMFNTSETLFDMLEAENMRQVEKWGVQTHSPFEWLTYTTEELGELAQAISEHYYRNGDILDIVKEAIQVATLALKIAEMYYTKAKDEFFDEAKNA